MITLFHPPRLLEWSWAANYLFHSISKRYADLTRMGEEWDDHIPRIKRAEIEDWRRRIECCFEDLEPFYDHCHYTPSGNRLVAEHVLAFLTRSLELHEPLVSTPTLRE